MWVEVIFFDCSQELFKFSGGKDYSPLSHTLCLPLALLPSGLAFECVPGCFSSGPLDLDPSMVHSYSLFLQFFCLSYFFLSFFCLLLSYSFSTALSVFFPLSCTLSSHSFGMLCLGDKHYFWRWTHTYTGS